MNNRLDAVEQCLTTDYPDVTGVDHLAGRRTAGHRHGPMVRHKRPFDAGGVAEGMATGVTPAEHQRNCFDRLTTPLGEGDVEPIVLSVPTIPRDTSGLVSVLNHSSTFVASLVHPPSVTPTPPHYHFLCRSSEAHSCYNTSSIPSVTAGSTARQPLFSILDGERLAWVNVAVLLVRSI